MKHQRVAALVIVVLLILAMGNAVFAAGCLSAVRTKYNKEGYTCTSIYHEGKQDEGFAAFRAVKKGKLLYNIATAVGTSESSDNQYAARPAYGYVQYQHSYLLTNVVGTITYWHTNEATWTDMFGTFQKSVKKVVVRGKLVSDDMRFTSLTDWVKDTE